MEGGGLWWRGIISIIGNIVILKFHPTLDQKTQTKPPTNIYTRKQRIKISPAGNFSVCVERLSVSAGGYSLSAVGRSAVQS